MSKYMRAIKFLLVIAVVAIGLGYAGSSHSLTYSMLENDWPIFALCMGLAFVVQWLMFIPAYIWQTERYFDLTGSLTYISVTILALILAGKEDLRSLLLVAMVLVWALRLGSFLFRRILQDGSDHRFDQIKPNAPRFFVVWTLQGLWVSFTAAAALAAISSESVLELRLLDSLAIALWIIGFAFEVISDRQKRLFRADPTNKGRYINTGLWAYSRHPNYFGEICLWIGVAILAVPVLQAWQYAALLSPIFVIVLLTRISGIPGLEAGADKRWGEEAEYQAYKQSTPVLIPKLTSGK